MSSAQSRTLVRFAVGILAGLVVMVPRTANGGEVRPVERAAMVQVDASGAAAAQPAASVAP